MPPDALLRPVGPRPPGVYWRRRGALLGGLLLLLVLLRSCGGDGTDTAAPAVQVSPGVGGARPEVSVPPGATPTVTASRASAGSATPGTSPSAATSPSPSAAPGAAATCASGALTVRATTDSRVYAAVARPRLTLVVVNTGPTPCRVDLGQAQRELRVLSGPDRVWSSDDCAPGGAAEPRLLQPRQQVAYPVTWSRTRSRPGCAGDQEAARPGTYRVVGRLGDRTSGETVFTLR